MHTFLDAITSDKAMEILGVGSARLTTLVKSGELPAEKVNAHLLLFERSDVVKLASETARGVRGTHPHRSAPPNLNVNGKPVPLDDVISTAEAAEVIGVNSAEYVCWLIRHNRLPGRKMHGRGWVVRRKDAEEYRDNPSHEGRPRNGRKKAG